jgi:cyclohexanone monooxygenase
MVVAFDGNCARTHLDDVHSEPPIPREALTDECEILSEAGFGDVRFCEKGDVGGTWYWNCYPGIACDVELLS